MAVFLIIVIGLIIWSLRLMQGALKLREASLLLASLLVAVSAGGVIVVYMLMDGCMSQLAVSHAAMPMSEYAPLVTDFIAEPETTLSANLFKATSL